MKRLHRDSLWSGRQISNFHQFESGMLASGDIKATSKFSDQVEINSSLVSQLRLRLNQPFNSNNKLN